MTTAAGLEQLTTAAKMNETDGDTLVEQSPQPTPQQGQGEHSEILMDAATAAALSAAAIAFPRERVVRRQGHSRVPTDVAVQVLMSDLTDFMAQQGAVYVCDFPDCGKSLKSRQQLRMHKRHHGYKQAREEEAREPRPAHPTNKVYCPVGSCKKHSSHPHAVPLSSMHALVTHWRRAHQVRGEEAYACSRPNCGKRFHIKKDLQTHEKWCGIVFKCVCGCEFGSKVGLTGHIKLEATTSMTPAKEHGILGGTWEAMVAMQHLPMTLHPQEGQAIHPQGGTPGQEPLDLPPEHGVHRPQGQGAPHSEPIAHHYDPTQFVMSHHLPTQPPHPGQ